MNIRSLTGFNARPNHRRLLSPSTTARAVIGSGDLCFYASTGADINPATECLGIASWIVSWTFRVRRVARRIFARPRWKSVLRTGEVLVANECLPQRIAGTICVLSREMK